MQSQEMRSVTPQEIGASLQLPTWQATQLRRRTVWKDLQQIFLRLLGQRRRLFLQVLGAGVWLRLHGLQMQYRPQVMQQ